jgi:hypothetical protein
MGRSRLGQMCRRRFTELERLSLPALEAFWSANERDERLPADMDFGAPYSLIDEKAFDFLIRTPGTHGMSGFYERFLDAPGLLTIGESLYRGVCGFCWALLLLLASSAASADDGRACSIPRPTGDTLNAVWGVNDGVWAVGDGGALVRSVDGGETWPLVDSGTRHDLLSIWGSGERDLWAVGKAATILPSENAGASWRRLDPGSSGDCAAVWGSGADDVFIACDKGQVLRTHDSGQSFEIQRPLGETDERFTGVWGSTADDVCVVGDRGSVVATRDGGKVWEIRRAQTPARASRPKIPTRASHVSGCGFRRIQRAHLDSGQPLEGTTDSSDWPNTMGRGITFLSGPADPA